MTESQQAMRLPDRSVRVLDERFARYVLALAKVERIATGFRWAEGPVWFGDQRALLWSDVPGNRIMRWDESTGETTLFRTPSDYSNGNTRDNAGRLITCEHGTRRLTRTRVRRHHHGAGRPLAGQAAELSERRHGCARRLGVVHRPDLRDPRRLRGIPGGVGVADQPVSSRS